MGGNSRAVVFLHMIVSLLMQHAHVCYQLKMPFVIIVHQELDLTKLVFKLIKVDEKAKNYTLIIHCMSYVHYMMLLCLGSVLGALHLA